MKKPDEFYLAVLKAIELLMGEDPAEGTPEFQLLVDLGTCVEAYEKKVFTPQIEEMVNRLIGTKEEKAFQELIETTEDLGLYKDEK